MQSSVQDILCLHRKKDSRVHKVSRIYTSSEKGYTQKVKYRQSVLMQILVTNFTARNKVLQIIL